MITIVGLVMWILLTVSLMWANRCRRVMLQQQRQESVMLAGGGGGGDPSRDG